MTRQELRLAFDYNPDTGAITRRTRQGNYPAGSLCAGKFMDGYAKVTYKGKQFKAHRLAWMLHTGELPPEQIDHKNLDKSDNRWDNLRPANSSTNQQNIRVHTRNQLGIKGIFPLSDRPGYFRAEVCINGKRLQKCSKDLAVLENWVRITREINHAFVRN